MSLAIATFAILVGQSPMVDTARKEIALRPGEILRVMKHGGRTRYGLYSELLVVYWDGNCISKSGEFGSRRFKLDRKGLNTLKAQLARFDMAVAKAQPRKDSYPPSAADGTDIFFGLRKGKSKLYWDNVGWNAPEPFPFMEYIDNVLLPYGRPPSR